MKVSYDTKQDLHIFQVNGFFRQQKKNDFNIKNCKFILYHDLGFH